MKSGKLAVKADYGFSSLTSGDMLIEVSKALNGLALLSRLYSHFSSIEATPTHHLLWHTRHIRRYSPCHDVESGGAHWRPDHQQQRLGTGKIALDVAVGHSAGRRAAGLPITPPFPRLSPPTGTESGHRNLVLGRETEAGCQPYQQRLLAAIKPPIALFQFSAILRPGCRLCKELGLKQSRCCSGQIHLATVPCRSQHWMVLYTAGGLTRRSSAARSK